MEQATRLTPLFEHDDDDDDYYFLRYAIFICYFYSPKYPNSATISDIIRYLYAAILCHILAKTFTLNFLNNYF
jgi:hypothetical protein